MHCSSDGFKVFILVVILFLSAFWLRSRLDSVRCSHKYSTIHIRSPSEIKPLYWSNCTVDTCFDLLPCSVDDRRLTVYVEPITSIFNEKGVEITPRPSREFLELRNVIKKSRFRVDSLQDACLVIPGVDTLNMNRFSDYQHDFYRTIAAGDRFIGRNLFLFTFVGRDIAAGKALIARAQSHRETFRRGFDIAIPLWLPPDRSAPQQSEQLTSADQNKVRPFKLAVIVRFATDPLLTVLRGMFFDSNDVLWLDTCESHDSHVCDSTGNSYSMEQALKRCEFALVDDRIPSHEITLMISLRSGAIPVILSDTPILPFGEVLQWRRFSLTFHHSRLNQMKGILDSMSESRKSEMRQQIYFIYTQYFSSLPKITLTTLEILEKRIVPNLARFSHEWNIPRGKMNISPMFLPRLSPAEGFTAVILAYNRIEPLFTLIRLMARVPSLVAVVVVWNNANVKPPPVSEWPHIQRPIKVIRMDENRLSNRFIAFEEIKTEAVFSLDDDMYTLTVEEIQFAYQTWRENPERMVGFVPKNDASDSSSVPYAYNLDKTNNMSIVLTAAAFYHKYYGILYHTVLPLSIRQYVHSIGSCEDIAMNYLITGLTGKYPLKITPKKNFECKQCTKNGISVRDAPRLAQRSKCIEKFSTWIVANSKVSQQFSFDPVLYRYAASVALESPYKRVGIL